MEQQKQETPQSKVFITPELLEIILLRLDLRTLLVSAQRVCKTWTALIQSSPAIQQALFFQSAPKLKSEKVKEHAKSACNSIVTSPFKTGSSNRDESIYPQPFYNPLLVHSFRPFFPSAEEYPAIYDNGESQTKSASGTSPEAEERKSGDRFSFKPLDMLSCSEKKTAYMRKEASWRKMHLRQPPVHGYIAIFTIDHAMGGDTYLAYKASRKPSEFPNEQEEVSRDGNTIKMGLLFDTLIHNPDLDFGRFGTTKVYWSAHVPPCDPGEKYPPRHGSYNELIKEGFSKVIGKTEVVLLSREVVQCSTFGEVKLTEEEELRAEIMTAETKIAA